MVLTKMFYAPKGYARVYSARAFVEADKLARQLHDQGRVVALVYSHNVSYAVYAKV